MTTTTLDAFGVIVDDLAVAVAFYRRLGVPFPEGAENAPGHAEAEVGSLRFMLDSAAEIESFDSEWRAPEGSPRFAIALNCGTPENVDALYAEALAAGGRAYREPWDAFWGQRYAQLRDPSGNGVDLYAALPAAG